MPAVLSLSALDVHACNAVKNPQPMLLHCWIGCGLCRQLKKWQRHNSGGPMDSPLEPSCGVELHLLEATRGWMRHFLIITDDHAAYASGCEQGKLCQ